MLSKPELLRAKDLNDVMLAALQQALFTEAKCILDILWRKWNTLLARDGLCIPNHIVKDKYESHILENFKEKIFFPNCFSLIIQRSIHLTQAGSNTHHFDYSIHRLGSWDWTWPPPCSQYDIHYAISAHLRKKPLTQALCPGTSRDYLTGKHGKGPYDFWLGGGGGNQCVDLESH